MRRQIRHARDLARHTRKLLRIYRDVMDARRSAEINEACDDLEAAIASSKTENLSSLSENVEKQLMKHIPQRPHPAVRENTEVLLVALLVAMAVRTFFIQPFKIPTGSMQPTLFGVTSENLIKQPDFKIPTGLTRVREWFEGISYLDVTARTDGRLDEIGAPHGIKIWNVWQTLKVGGKTHTIWFPPDYGQQDLGTRAGLQPEKSYRKGEQVIRLKTQAGDHLFVDRMSYNFRKPSRGDIIVPLRVPWLIARRRAGGTARRGALHRSTRGRIQKGKRRRGRRRPGPHTIRLVQGST